METNPLAFGLKFIQVHVVMNDGSGLSDVFEENMRAIRGIGEIEKYYRWDFFDNCKVALGILCSRRFKLTSKAALVAYA